jgi:hypothetical protein
LYAGDESGEDVCEEGCEGDDEVGRRRELGIPWQDVIADKKGDNGVEFMVNIRRGRSDRRKG